ncbi:MAG: response regulator [Peptococcaceae bacterium]|nr:response regulator [Peptococcaceae bacterium]
MGKPLILVVDDQVGIRRLLYEAFGDDGFEVELASGGAEALRKLGQCSPQVVLLDLRMPGVSGLDTLKELRSRQPGLNVIIMTAYGEMDLVREARRLGVDWCITKPFDLVELRYMVKGVIAGGTAGGTAEHACAGLVAAT